MLLGDNDTENHDMLLERLKKQRLKSDPGRSRCTATMVLHWQEILTERVTGLSFTEYVEREFADQLGLTQFKTPQSSNLSGPPGEDIRCRERRGAPCGKRQCDRQRRHLRDCHGPVPFFGNFYEEQKRQCQAAVRPER